MKYINLQIQESKWATNRINSKVINKLWKQKTKKFLKEVRENWYIMHVCVAQSHPILCDPMDCSPPGSSVHEDSPRKDTGVGWHALFQSVFPTQEQTQVSCIAGRFFTIWATREAQEYWCV